MKERTRLIITVVVIVAFICGSLLLAAKLSRPLDKITTGQAYAKLNPSLNLDAPDPAAEQRYEQVGRYLAAAQKEAAKSIFPDPVYRTINGKQVRDEALFRQQLAAAEDAHKRSEQLTLQALSVVRQPIEQPQTFHAEPDGPDVNPIGTLQSCIYEGQDSASSPFTDKNMQSALSFARMYCLLEQSSGDLANAMAGQLDNDLKNVAQLVARSKGITIAQAQQILDAMPPSSLGGELGRSQIQGYVAVAVEEMADPAKRMKALNRYNIPATAGFDANATIDLINRVFVPQIDNLSKPWNAQDDSWKAAYDQIRRDVQPFRTLQDGPTKTAQLTMLMRQHPNVAGEAIVFDNTHLEHFVTALPGGVASSRRGSSIGAAGSGAGRITAEGTIDAVEQIFEHRATYELVRTAIALKIYNLKYGNYPHNLQQLVSDRIIKSVPIDPFSGKEIQYKLNAVYPYTQTPLGDGLKANFKTPIIYSVGQDGVDDYSKGGIRFGLHDTIAAVGSEKFMSDADDFNPPAAIKK